MLNRVKGTVMTIALATVILPQVANAEERAFGDIYKECGLGAMIFKDTPIAAAVSNVVWDLGTTAILSNISSKENCKGGTARVAAFINDSYEKIEKDLASGDGKYLRTLTNLVTTSSQSKEEFVSTLRKNFSNIVASSDYSKLTSYQKAEKLYNIIY